MIDINKEKILIEYDKEDKVISSHKAAEELAKEKKALYTFKSKIPSLDRYIEGFEAGELIIISGPTKHGKCFAKGTEILMYDGSIKKVEDIKIEDRIMGDDSTPRNVSNLGQGKEMMYKVVNRDGSFYIVNESHILSLRKKWGGVDKIVNISVKDYLEKSNNFKWEYRGYKKGTNFKNQEIKISPYFLGLWLGDGCSEYPSINTADKEIVKYLYKTAKELEMRITKIEEDSKADSYNFVSKKYKAKLLRIEKGKRGGKIIYYQCKNCRKEFKLKTNSNGIFCSNECFVKRNKLLNLLREYNLINNKHIPKEYLINSRKNRLQLLAGLIDSDGYYSEPNGTLFSNKNKLLIDNVVFLARSLGFYASIRRSKIKNQFYYDIYISGKIEEIPVLLRYKTKIIKTSFRKNLLSQRIKVEKLKVDDYYGFEIDGNKLFLLGDFTVTHNTTFSESLTKNFEQQDIKCLWFEFEVPQRQFITKFKDLPLFYLPAQLKDKDMNWIKDRIIEGILKYNTRIVFIDHLHYLIDIYKTRDASLDIGRVIRDLKRFAVDNDIVIFTMAHTTKVQLEKMPSSEDIRDSSFIPQEADSTFMIWREVKKGKKTGILEYTGITYLLIANHRRTGVMAKTIKLVFNDGYLSELDENVQEPENIKEEEFGDIDQILLDN